MFDTALRVAASTEKGPDDSPAQVLAKLRSLSGKELHALIVYLKDDYDKRGLPAAELDEFIAILDSIEASDGYTAPLPTKGDAVMGYPNRRAAKRAVFEFRVAKITNPLNNLPTKKRVAGILRCMETRPIPPYNTVGTFARELVAVGPPAIPQLLAHKPRSPRVKKAIIWALGEIGDESALGYITGVLQSTNPADIPLRDEAIAALACFNGPRVMRALVDALRDDSSKRVQRVMWQTALPNATGHVSRKKRIPTYPARSYANQEKAASCLTKATGLDWGPVFNEDFKTWDVWLTRGEPAVFEPASIPRSEKELSVLMARLVDRFMCGRLVGRSDRDAVIQGLKGLDKSVIAPMRQYANGRIELWPEWDAELNCWLSTLESGMTGARSESTLKD